jgi:hypothetical protein
MARKAKPKTPQLTPHRLGVRQRKYSGPPYPVPEIIDGGEWEIRQSQSLRTAGISQRPDRPGGKMLVPLGEAEVARLVRAHELMHVHITPKEWPRPYDGRLMNLVEDARDHAHLRQSGFDLEPLTGIIEPAELQPESLAELHPAILAALSLSAWGTGEQYRVQMAISAIGRDDLNVIAGEIYNHYGLDYERPTVDDLGSMADDLVRILGNPEETPYERPPYRPDLEALMPRRHSDDERVEWAEMHIKRVPLTRRLAPQMRTRRPMRPDIRGRRLRRVGRLYVDGKVLWNRQRARGGGAVLIDTSGSMSLTHHQVEQIVQALPGGIVATYGGCGDWGELRIVAEKGRYCSIDDLTPQLGGNGIDGPALEWLAKQPGPHYWVSDGGVTGCGDRSSPLLSAQTRTICEKHQILRVASTDVLLDG